MIDKIVVSVGSAKYLFWKGKFTDFPLIDNIGLRIDEWGLSVDCDAIPLMEKKYFKQSIKNDKFLITNNWNRNQIVGSFNFIRLSGKFGSCRKLFNINLMRFAK
jgi:hypothetical protein